MLSALTSDPRNSVWIISGRARAELADWFGGVVSCAALHVIAVLLPKLTTQVVKCDQAEVVKSHLTSCIVWCSVCCAQENLGLAAEHGFYWRPNASSEWLTLDPEQRFGWKDIVQPILQARRRAGVSTLVCLGYSCPVGHSLATLLYAMVDW
jgi:trehalose-6-phosphatase